MQAGREKVIGDRTAGVTGEPLAFDLPGGGTGEYVRNSANMSASVNVIFAPEGLEVSAL